MEDELPLIHISRLYYTPPFLRHSAQQQNWLYHPSLVDHPADYRHTGFGRTTIRSTSRVEPCARWMHRHHACLGEYLEWNESEWSSFVKWLSSGSLATYALSHVGYLANTAFVRAFQASMPDSTMLFPTPRRRVKMLSVASPTDARPLYESSGHTS